MPIVVGMDGYSMAGAPGLAPCWLCQKDVSGRALFCSHCGSLQAPRDLDHFMRLGLDRKVDLDLGDLEKQYQGFLRILAPERFILKGLGERTHAEQQMEAIQLAYTTLRDPVKRGRYWLELNEQQNPCPCDADSVLHTLEADLAAAPDAPALDQVARQVGQAMEQGILRLLACLRAGNWVTANQILTEIDGLEALLEKTRGKRNTLTKEGAR
jgi:molecular chaperone HscB